MKMFFVVFFILSASQLHAESKRVQVFDKGQQYWDVKNGDSLSYICQQLIPGNHQLQLKLQQQILAENADAFINASADKLIAGKRLWLPGSYRVVSDYDKNKYEVKQFSWGSIRKPR